MERSSRPYASNTLKTSIRTTRSEFPCKTEITKAILGLWGHWNVLVLCVLFENFFFFPGGPFSLERQATDKEATAPNGGKKYHEKKQGNSVDEQRARNPSKMCNLQIGFVHECAGRWRFLARVGQSHEKDSNRIDAPQGGWGSDQKTDRVTTPSQRGGRISLNFIEKRLFVSPESQEPLDCPRDGLFFLILYGVPTGSRDLESCLPSPLLSPLTKLLRPHLSLSAYNISRLVNKGSKTPGRIAPHPGY